MRARKSLRLIWRGVVILSIALAIAAVAIWRRSADTWDEIRLMPEQPNSATSSDFMVTSGVGSVSIDWDRDTPAPSHSERAAALRSTAAYHWEHNSRPVNPYEKTNPALRVFGYESRTAFLPGSKSFDARWSVQRTMAVRYYMVICLALLLPAWWCSLAVRRRLIRSRRLRRGCCARCGYDLRGTPGQCPECGWRLNAPDKDLPSRAHHASSEPEAGPPHEAESLIRSDIVDAAKFI